MPRCAAPVVANFHDLLKARALTLGTPLQILRRSTTVDLAVPFTNNQAEHDIRPVKLQQKISATWRTLPALADFAVPRSYLSTAAKHGMDALDVLRQLFTTGPWRPATAESS